MKVLLWIIGIPVGGFALLFLAFLIAEIISPTSPPTTVQRIAEGCQQEYGDRGPAAVDECKLRMSLRFLTDRERAKDNAAYGRVR